MSENVLHTCAFCWTMLNPKYVEEHMAWHESLGKDTEKRIKELEEQVDKLEKFIWPSPEDQMEENFWDDRTTPMADG